MRAERAERESSSAAPPVVDYASPATAPQHGAWWLIGELLAAAVVFIILTAVFLVGTSLWWGGPTGQLGGALYVAAIAVPMIVGAGGCVWLGLLVGKVLREYRR